MKNHTVLFHNIDLLPDNATVSEENTSAQRIQELRSFLEYAIHHELTPLQQETLHMFYAGGCNCTQIAKKRGVAVSTVSRSIARSHKRLRYLAKIRFPHLFLDKNR